MEDKKNKSPALVTKGNVVDEHYPEDYEFNPALRYPEYKAEIRDFAEINVIKQGGSYTRMAFGQKLLFLEIYKYQSPNTPLDQFMKTYEVPVSKGVSP